MSQKVQSQKLSHFDDALGIWSFPGYFLVDGYLQIFPRNDFRDEMENQLTLDELRIAPVNEVATALGFKGPKQFRVVWEKAGYRILRPSPKKHVVFVADVARFLSERILPITHITEDV